MPSPPRDPRPVSARGWASEEVAQDMRMTRRELEHRARVMADNLGSDLTRMSLEESLRETRMIDQYASGIDEYAQRGLRPRRASNRWCASVPDGDLPASSADSTVAGAPSITRPQSLTRSPRLSSGAGSSRDKEGAGSKQAGTQVGKQAASVLPPPPPPPTAASALQAARDNGRLHLLAWFDCGGGVDVANEHGETLLMGACSGAHERLVTLLLERGATVDLPDERGRTALMAACKASAPRIVRRLLSAGADRELESHDGRKALDELRIACQSRVLDGPNFARLMACTRALADAAEAKEMERLENIVGSPSKTITPSDVASLGEWQQRAATERSDLDALQAENLRRLQAETSHLQDSFVRLVSESSGKNVLDMAGGFAEKMAKGRRTVRKAAEWGAPKPPQLQGVGRVAGYHVVEQRAIGSMEENGRKSLWAATRAKAASRLNTAGAAATAGT